MDSQSQAIPSRSSAPSGWPIARLATQTAGSSKARQHGKPGDILTLDNVSAFSGPSRIVLSLRPAVSLSRLNAQAELEQTPLFARTFDRGILRIGLVSADKVVKIQTEDGRGTKELIQCAFGKRSDANEFVASLPADWGKSAGRAKKPGEGQTQLSTGPTRMNPVQEEHSAQVEPSASARKVAHRVPAATSSSLRQAPPPSPLAIPRTAKLATSQSPPSAARVPLPTVTPTRARPVALAIPSRLQAALALLPDEDDEDDEEEEPATQENEETRTEMEEVLDFGGMSREELRAVMAEIMAEEEFVELVEKVRQELSVK